MARVFFTFLTNPFGRHSRQLAGIVLTATLSACSAIVDTGFDEFEFGSGKTTYKLAFTPTSKTFPTLTIGANTTEVFTLTNNDTVTVENLSVIVAGIGFSRAATTCADTIDPGATCTVSVQFAPTITGSFTGLLSALSGLNPVTTANLTGDTPAASGGTTSLVFNPVSQSFGTIAAGANTSQTLSLHNDGDELVEDLTVTIVGDGFSLDSTTCGTTLAASASCNVVVEFAPGFGGGFSGFAQAKLDGVLATSAGLSGTATSASALRFTPNNYNFGSVFIGQTRSLSLTLENTSGVQATALNITTNDATIFPITSTDCGATLDAGLTCEVNINFAPDVGSTVFSSQIIATDSGGSIGAAVSGTGATPAFDISPVTTDFGGVVIGGNATENITITNGAAAAVTGLQVSVLGAGYSITSNTCTSYSASFGSGQSCVVAVRFSPSSSGTADGFLLVEATGLTDVTSDLTGTGASKAVLGSSATNHAFGTRFTSVGASQGFTISNSGGATATSFTAVIDDTTNYSVTNGCGTSVGGSSNCTVTVNYLPTNESTHNATLTIGYHDGLASQTILITVGGTGRYPPVLALTPGSRAFDSVTIGNNKEQTFTVTNSGQGTSYASGITVTSSSPSFVVHSNTCSSGNLTGGNNCTFVIEFEPRSIQAYSESVTVDYTERTALSASVLNSTFTGTAANGKAWYRLTGSTTNAARPTFVSSLVGYIPFQTGLVGMTTDGGLTWFPRTTAVTNNLTTSTNRGATKVFLGADGGEVMTSADSGYTFLTRTSSDLQETWSIACGDDDNCYMGGRSNISFNWYRQIKKTTDAGANWTFKTGQNSGANNTTAHGMAALNASTTLSVGDGIHKSIDGETTYYPVLRNADVFNFSRLVGSTLYASGTGGHLRVSTDGGATWKAAPHPRRLFSNELGVGSYECWDANNCITGGASWNNGRFYRTIDGGANWIESGSMGYTYFDRDLVWIDADTIYAGMSLYGPKKSTDRGVTWTNLSAWDVSTQAMSCTDANNCLMTAGANPSSILKTTDGGTGWMATFASGELREISHAAGNTWVVGEYSVIFKSTDNGATWSPVTPPAMNRHFYGVSFVDANTGWVVGDGGKIYKTTNSGTSWTEQTSGTATTLNSVHFVDANTGWAVGGSVALKTTDGGANWAAQTVTGGYGFNHVTAASATTAWIGGNKIFRTTDGSTWAEEANYAVGAIANVDGTTLWASPTANGTAIYKSTDGGDTWTQETITSRSSPFGLAVSSDGDRIFASGYTSTSNRNLLSVNAGSSWTTPTVNAPPAGQLSELHFKNLAVVDESGGDAANIVIATTTRGAIYRSTDSGSTWSQVSTGFAREIMSLTRSPSDPNMVWATIPDSEAILKSVDGGTTWSVLTSDVECNPYDVIAFNDDDLVMVPYSISNGSKTATSCISKVMLSSDGGASWSFANLPAHESPGSVRRTTGKLINAGTGIALIGGTYGAIYRTTDFGANWTKVSAEPYYSTMYDIHMVDATTGYAVGSRSYIYKTTDGGDSWVQQTTAGSTQTLYGTHFYDVNYGMAVGESNTVFLTTDAGTNWTLTATGLGTRTWNFRDVVMTAQDTATLTTTTESIARFYQGAWSDVSWQPTWNWFYTYGLAAIDPRTVIAVRTGGQVMRSTNGGVTWTWTDINGGATTDLRRVRFVNSTTGWIVGADRQIYKSTDSGANWSAQTSSMVDAWRDLYDISCVDTNVCYIVGEGGKAEKTIDGGANWTQVTTGTANHLNSVFALDANTVVAVGNSGTILRTTDGGANWSSMSSSPSIGANHIYSVVFVNSTTGWFGGASGKLYKTTDGGVNWAELTSGTAAQINEVAATSTNHVWFSTASSYQIHYSTNGGAAWTGINTGVSDGIQSISCVGQYNCYIGGFYGIYKTVTGGQNP